MCSLYFTCYILNSMYRKALHVDAVKGEIVHRVQSGVTKADQYATRINEHRSTIVSRPSLVKIEYQARIISAQMKKTEDNICQMWIVCSTYNLKRCTIKLDFCPWKDQSQILFFQRKKMTSQYAPIIRYI